MSATVTLLASLIAVGAADLQARVVAPENLQDLIRASDVVIVGEVERGLFWGLAMAGAVLVLLLRRRARVLLPAIVCCASCRGGVGAGDHSIVVKRVLRGTCPEPAIQLTMPSAGPCYEPDLGTGTEYVMFLRESDAHYTTSWTAHALLPIENGKVKATWRSEHGKVFTVEELAKMLSKG